MRPFIVALAIVGGLSCPPPPTPEPPPTLPDEPTPTPIPDAPGRICLPQGEGPADCNCWHLPPGSPSWVWADCTVSTPTPTPEPEPSPTAPPTPPIPGADCGLVVPGQPVPVVGGHLIGPTVSYRGMTLAVSSCRVPTPQPNGRCYPEDIPWMEWAEDETECWSLDHWMSNWEPVRGMACYAGLQPSGEGSYASGDPEETGQGTGKPGRGCTDAYGRNVIEDPYGSGHWRFRINRSPEDTQPLCRPLVTQPCPELPEPQCDGVLLCNCFRGAVHVPCETPAPTPVEGIGITIGVRCGGASPNCDVHEASPEPNRRWRARIVGTPGGTTLILDSSYYLGQQGNKIHDYDPRYPGPIESWHEDVISGDWIDCTMPGEIDPNGHVLRCSGIDHAYDPGTRNRWTVCGPAGVCGSVTVEVVP
jgi:hypothetical protein